MYSEKPAKPNPLLLPLNTKTMTKQKRITPTMKRPKSLLAPASPLCWIDVLTLTCSLPGVVLLVDVVAVGQPIDTVTWIDAALKLEIHAIDSIDTRMMISIIVATPVRTSRRDTTMSLRHHLLRLPRLPTSQYL